jgi:hypothetical protein
MDVWAAADRGRFGRTPSSDKVMFSKVRTGSSASLLPCSLCGKRPKAPVQSGSVLPFSGFRDRLREELKPKDSSAAVEIEFRAY